MPNESSLPERLAAKLVRIFGILALVFLALASFGPVMDNVDIGWHVAQGRWMAQHAALYRQDAFNYPNLGHAVIDEYPLFQLVLYAFWSLGGWGPSLLTALVYLTLAAVLIHAARQLDVVYASIFNLALGLLLLCLQVGPMLRPHMVSYLAIAVLGVFLLRHRDATRWTAFWPMALLQIAWTNCHSAFVIGPALVALFGAEVTLRRWIADQRFPTATARTWLGAFALILLACLVNPYGIARFYPVFEQEHLESIRAYVGEMEPLAGPLPRFYELIALVVVVLAWNPGFRQWRRFWPSLALLALLFLVEAQSAKKAWPVFGLFLPLIVLAAGSAGPSNAIAQRLMTAVQLLVLNFMTTSLLALAVFGTWTSTRDAWHELAVGHSEMSHEAIAWMKAHHIEGRLFHRCEDGGLLQLEGFTQTFSDTGFGKFDEAFIHETGLVNERPKLVPRYLAAYQPDYVVCSNWCYQWPYYLKQAGWRLIFYSPNSSVWTRPETRPDLPTVTDEEIKAAFEQDLKTNGLPAQIALFGRNIIALNSLGLGDFAYDQLTRPSPDFKFQPWFWEAARLLCFVDPPLSPAHRDDFVKLSETGDEKMPGSYQFRGYATFVQADADRAFQMLASVAPDKLTNASAEALARIELDRNDPAALALARRTDCWDLRNGKHWEYLAEAEERWGSLDAARIAWRKAVFYYPDDDELTKSAAAFAAQHDDAGLQQAIAGSAKVYGAPK